MAKNSVKQIEKDEKKILRELSANANKSINEIAKNCGFSRQKVWRIIKNLEKNNTIWGYVAVVNEEKQDKKEFILLVTRTNKPIQGKTINQIVSREFAKNAKKIGIRFLYSAYTNGKYDWVIFFTAKDIKEAKSFVELFNRTYEGQINEIALIENMFTAVKCGFTNPEIEGLREYFKV